MSCWIYYSHNFDKSIFFFQMHSETNYFNVVKKKFMVINFQEYKKNLGFCFDVCNIFSHNVFFP